VLARACSSQAEGGESDLKPLIYPLVQVSLGAIKYVVCPRLLKLDRTDESCRLISNLSSYPFRLQIIRSLLHLSRHTETYIPIPPYLLPILISPLTFSRPKPSTLRPLDLEVHIRVPQQYVKTRVYADNLVEEAVFLLAEWLASRAVHGSVAFPEVIVPVTVVLRKAMKASSKGSAGVGNQIGIIKGLVERMEESAQWIEQRRKGVAFAPGKNIEVERWELAIKEKIEESPLGKYVKVQRKARDKRRNLIDKVRVIRIITSLAAVDNVVDSSQARDGEEEILDN
jgi:nucleolar complex protein 2